MAAMAGNVGSQIQGEDCCAICLDSVTGEAFLDQCFHRFCYHCILQWSEMTMAAPLRRTGLPTGAAPVECPLCKSLSTSIIHDLVSETVFQRDSLLGQFRLSEAHRRRLAVYAAAKADGVLDTRTVSGVVKPNKWITCWVRRELQALMQDEDVNVVTHHVVGVVESMKKQSRVSMLKKESISKNWCDAVAAAVRPFVFEDAEIFAVELWKFLQAGIGVSFYDQELLDAAVRVESKGEGPAAAAEIVRLGLLDEDLEDG